MSSTRAPLRTQLRAQWMTLAVSCVLTVVPLVVFMRGSTPVRLTVLAVVLVAVAGYLATVHPLSIFAAMVLVLGLVPYLRVPGTKIPVLLVLAVGIWVALAFLPGVRFRPGWPEVWLILLAAVAFLSVVATDLSVDSLTEYAAWLAATAIVVPVRFLPAGARASVVRVFVLSCAAASAIGILLVRIDPYGQLLGRLTFAGYDPATTNVQQVRGTETLATRLTGTFVEPNIAALVLGVGLILAVAYFRGPMRIALVAVVGTGVVLTLSRAAIAAIVVAAALLVLRVDVRRRLMLLGAGAAAAAALLAVPVVRSRLLDSFGPSDTGTIARASALDSFPQLLSGHWTWGLGWALEEFRDPGVGRAINIVANAPLLTVYRGGVILGALAFIVLAVLAVRSWSASRRSFADAAVCCGVLGYLLVAAQLDFSLAIQAPATAVFSLLVGISLRADAQSAGAQSADIQSADIQSADAQSADAQSGPPADA